MARKWSGKSSGYIWTCPICGKRERWGEGWQWWPGPGHASMIFCSDACMDRVVYGDEYRMFNNNPAWDRANKVLMETLEGKHRFDAESREKK